MKEPNMIYLEDYMKGTQTHSNDLIKNWEICGLQ